MLEVIQSFPITNNVGHQFFKQNLYSGYSKSQSRSICLFKENAIRMKENISYMREET